MVKISLPSTCSPAKETTANLTPHPGWAISPESVLPLGPSVVFSLKLLSTRNRARLLLFLQSMASEVGAISTGTPSRCRILLYYTHPAPRRPLPFRSGAPHVPLHTSLTSRNSNLQPFFLLASRNSHVKLEFALNLLACADSWPCALKLMCPR